MDSDEVNSVGDTIEAQQVANIVKNCYYDILTEIELPDEYTLFSLDASTDPGEPVVMGLPDNIENVDWIKYNKIDPSVSNYQQFERITYLPIDEFLRIVQSYVTTETNIGSFVFPIEGATVDLLYYTDRAPEYYTTFDNRKVVFNALNTDFDVTLQSSKTLCYGKKTPAFEVSDGFIPFKDSKYESLLFNMSKATAFAELKQTVHAKAEKAERRARIKTQSSKHSVEHEWPWYNQIQGYGRRK